jgi:hypothetical protein
VHIRVIASVGIVLCLAMTAFSIYLGIAEHVYQPPRTHVVEFATSGGREALCFSIQTHHNTTTTGPRRSVSRVSCAHTATATR